jgi:glycerate 2-kinase
MKTKNGEKVLDLVIRTAVSALDPSHLINKTLNIDTSKHCLKINDSVLQLNSESKNVYLCAFGKASLKMSLEFEKLLSNYLHSGICILPFSEYESSMPKWIKLDQNEIKMNDEIKSQLTYFYGAKNNLPDSDSLNATKKVFELIESINTSPNSVTPNILVCLISGGGSALLAQPQNFTNNSDYDFNLKLDTIRKTVRAGASINELNTIRMCLSRVKGGNLALSALSKDPSLKIVNLFISDVIGDPLEIIASGPTILNQTSLSSNKYQLSLDIIKKYKLENELSAEILNYLRENSKNNAALNVKNSDGIKNFLIGNNKLATGSISDELSREFEYRKVLSNSLSGEAKRVGSSFALLSFILSDIVKSEDQNLKFYSDFLTKEKEIHVDLDLIRHFVNLVLSDQNFKEGKPLKLALISGGETTVTLNSASGGKGGRNQEMVLSFELTFLELIGKFNRKINNVLFSSFGTDGIDGPTDAAGAYFNYEHLEQQPNNYDLKEMRDYLSRHDSYNYYNSRKESGLIKCGPTGTNCSDLQILLLDF